VQAHNTTLKLISRKYINSSKHGLSNYLIKKKLKNKYDMPKQILFFTFKKFLCNLSAILTCPGTRLAKWLSFDVVSRRTNAQAGKVHTESLVEVFTRRPAGARTRRFRRSGRRRCCCHHQHRRSPCYCNRIRLQERAGRTACHREYPAQECDVSRAVEPGKC
jgi:hypothetical protein